MQNKLKIYYKNLFVKIKMYYDLNISSELYIDYLRGDTTIL